MGKKGNILTGGIAPGRNTGKIASTYLGGGLTGVTNYWGDISGANAAAKATERSAAAARETASAERQLMLSESDRIGADLARLAEASPQELRAYEASLGAAEGQLQRRQKLLEAIDPAIMEASNQVLRLLRGEEAGATAPMKAQRDQQRAQLINSLRNQFGPGGETSSAGARQLRQFDMETNNMLQSTQAGSLNQLFGIAQAGQGFGLGQELGDLNLAGRNFSALQERKLNARQASGQSLLAALSGTSQNIINSAGSQYAGDLIRARAQGQMVNTGATILGSIYGGPAGGAAANAATKPTNGGNPLMQLQQSPSPEGYYEMPASNKGYYNVS